MVEIIKPKQIKQGLRLRIDFHINNVKAIDMNIERDINEAKASGDLANIMEVSWKLSSAPIIENIQCQRYESQQRRDNTEVINIRSVSMSSVDGNAMDVNQINRQIVMNKINQTVPLPPHIAPPIQPHSTAGHAMDNDGESDSNESVKETVGSTNGNTKDYDTVNHDNDDMLFASYS